MNAGSYDRLWNIRGVGPKRFASITQTLKDTGQAVDDLVQMSADAIKAQFGLPIHVAKAIAAVGRETTLRENNAKNKNTEDGVLSEKGIRVLKKEDKDYPERLKNVLGDHAPSVLYVWGNLDLLNKPVVGFCGSRYATDKGLEITADAAEQIAASGWVVVSGHAKGVDSTAHRVALENGAGTIIVAPQGILDFKLRQELKRIAKPEQLLIVSEFPPKAGWNVGYAMQRNQTILGLSDAMILVEARSSGGTFEAGKQALRLTIPLYVAQYESPGDSAAGNTYFIRQGAKPIFKARETGRARLDALKEDIKRMQHGSSVEVVPDQEQPKQLMLSME